MNRWLRWIGIAHILMGLTGWIAPVSAAAPGGSASTAGPVLTPGTTVDEAERQLIELTLAHTGGNKTRAADMLGISLKTLHNKLNRMKEEAVSE